MDGAQNADPSTAGTDNNNTQQIRDANEAEKNEEYHEQPAVSWVEAGRDKRPNNGRSYSSEIPDSFRCQEPFDQDGFELGADARVWKTYVKEATTHDLELVGEWNRRVKGGYLTLEVMLGEPLSLYFDAATDKSSVFAALFSAIVTTFLNESSKKLQEDYVETSARTLSVISQTLVAIAEARHLPKELQLASQGTNNSYQPKLMDVYVNTLWFTSLGLSIIVTFVAMLAKEWCFHFISGKPDEPYPQARKRQIRWNGITKWRMKQLMIVLPSLIYLALLLFAAGLCINLWVINFAVALPVAILSSGTVLIYLLSTLSHLTFDRCPYSTAASKLIRGFSEKTKEITWEYEQDKITSQSIAWLIGTSENRTSVDIALQAIAGADKNLPREALLKCGAIKMIKDRLKLLDLSTINAKDSAYMRVQALYFRALRYLEAAPLTKDEERRAELESKLRSRIRKLRDLLESITTRRVALENIAVETISSSANVSALKAATRAIAESYWVRERGLEQPSALAAITDQLELYGGNSDALHPASGLAVMVGAATLYSCMPRNESSTVARSMLHALSEQSQMPTQYLGIILAPFALSRTFSPNQSDDTLPTEFDPVLRAVESIIFYLPMIGTQSMEGSITAAMARFGLAHLLHNSVNYGLSRQDLRRVTTILAQLPVEANARAQFHGLPENIIIPDYVIHGLTNIQSDLPTLRPPTPQNQDNLPISSLVNHSDERVDVMSSLDNRAYLNESIHADLAVILLQQVSQIYESSSPVLSDLVRSLLQLFPKFLPGCPPTQVSKLLALLLAENHRLPNQYMGLLLVVLVLSWDSTSITTSSHLPQATTGVQQALWVTNYYTLFHQIDGAVSNVMINFGLLGLINHSRFAELGEDIAKRVYVSFEPLAPEDRDTVTFDGAPPEFNIHNYMTETLAHKLARETDQTDISTSQLAALTHVNILRKVYYSRQTSVVETLIDEDGSLPENPNAALLISSLEALVKNPDLALSTVDFMYVIGLATLSSTLLESCEPPMAANYILRIMNCPQLPERYLGLLLMAFGLARGTPATSSQTTTPSANPSEPILRAVEAIKVGAHHPETLQNGAGIMINLGIAELLESSDVYQLSEAQVKRLYRAFSPLSEERSTPTLDYLLPDFNTHEYTSNILTNRLISVCQQHDIAAAEKASIIHVTALISIYATQLGALPIASEFPGGELLLDTMDETSRLGLVFTLLAQLTHLSPPLHTSVVLSLTIGSAILMSTSLLSCEPISAARLILQLLGSEHQLSDRHLGILLLAFALSRSDPPGWSGPPLSPQTRVLRSLEAIAYYAPELDTLHEDISAIMINIGLLELLLRSRNYEISERDLRTIRDKIIPVPDSAASHTIPQLSPDFDIRTYATEVPSRQPSVVEDQAPVNINDDENVIRQNFNPSTPVNRPVAAETPADLPSDSPPEYLASYHALNGLNPPRKWTERMWMSSPLLWSKNLRDLRRKVRRLERNTIGSLYQTLGITTELPLSQMEQLSLDIGSGVEEQCLYYRAHPPRNRIPDILHSIRYLLQQGQQPLQPAVASTLVTRASMLLSCAFLDCEPPEVGKFMYQLLTQGRSIPNEYLGQLLATFAITMSDLLHAIPEEISALDRTSRAIVMIEEYAAQTQKHPNRFITGAMINLGLLELIKPDIYGLTEMEAEVIRGMFVVLPATEASPTLPLSLDVHEHIANTFSAIILTTTQNDRVANRAISVQIFGALQRIYPLLANPILEARGPGDNNTAMTLAAAMIERTDIANTNYPANQSPQPLPHKIIDLIALGVTVIMGSTLAECSSAEVGAFMRILLRNLGGFERNSYNAGLMLFTFALSRHDYPGWIHPPPLNANLRAMRARDVLDHYINRRAAIFRNLETKGLELSAFGLLALLSRAVEYGFLPEDFDLSLEQCAGIFDNVISMKPSHVSLFTIARTYDIQQHAYEVATGFLMNFPPPLQSHPAAMQTFLSVIVLADIGPHSPSDISERAYILAVELLLILGANPTARGRYAALDLLERFIDLSFSDNFFDLLHRKGIVAQLRVLSEDRSESDDASFLLRLFSTGQLFLFARRLSDSQHPHLREALSGVFRDLIGSKDISDAPHLAQRRLAGYSRVLRGQYTAMWDGHSRLLHNYFNRLYQLTRSQEEMNPPFGAE